MIEVGDKYIYQGDGASDRDPWFVEVVKISHSQVAYTWTTKYLNYQELHAKSNYIKSFLCEFKKKEAKGGRCE